jgi:hypothetical protein
MSDTFKYKITAFDNDKKLVTVEFADQSWATVALVVPLPIDLDELGALVSVYTQPAEHEEAVEDKNADLSFIAKNIGVEQETNRRRMQPKVTPIFADDDIDAMVAREIGPEATENQKKAKQTLEAAYRAYVNSVSLLSGPLSTKLTEKSKAQHAIFMTALTAMIIDANNAVKNNTPYEAILPMFEMELI